MTRTQWAAIAGVTLIVAYSVIMIATSGAAAYAWLLLAAGLALLATAGRRIAAQVRRTRDEGRAPYSSTARNRTNTASAFLSNADV